MDTKDGSRDFGISTDLEINLEAGKKRCWFGMSVMCYGSVICVHVLLAAIQNTRFYVYTLTRKMLFLKVPKKCLLSQQIYLCLLCLHFTPLVSIIIFLFALIYA